MVLLLASGLSYDDLRREDRLPHVRQLGDLGGVALLNTAVSGPATDAAAFLSVGGGDRLAAPDPRIAAEVYAPDARTPEGDDARNVYRRRFGEWPPFSDSILLHLGLPALEKAQPSPSRAAEVGALGEALRSAGLRSAVLGDTRAALVLMDRRGVVAGGALDGSGTPEGLAQALERADVVAVAVPDASALDELAGAMLPLARSGAAYVIVAIPAPPRGSDGRWARLGFVVAAGPGIAARSLLVSPTTRTPGLVANVDLAPSVLHWQDVPATIAGAGRAIRTVSRTDPWAALSLLDRQVVATRNATVPVLIGYAVFAIGACLAAVIALLGNREALARAARFGLLMAAAALVAFLPVGVLAPQSAWSYGAAVAGSSAFLAVLATLFGRRLGVPPQVSASRDTSVQVSASRDTSVQVSASRDTSVQVSPPAPGAGTRRDTSALGVLLTGAAITVAVDAVFGAPLVSRSLLSGYFLPGIRFYGVGNEYMGLAVGAALVGPLLGSNPMDRRWVRVLWIAVVLAIGMPFWGADAGGALGATVAFVTGFFALRLERLRARHVAAAFAAGLIVLLAVAGLDRMRPADQRSHVGAAIATGQARGSGALWEIAARKIEMNVGLALTPGTAGALAGLAPVWWLLARGRLGKRAADALAARPRLRRVLPAAAWGAFAALVFNDSGIVAALLLLAPPTASVIDGLLCDSLP